ncbi:MAG: hypothetical protein HOM68_06480 [Gemmatimonadetes bacterium]|jgi:hypothetical protein|nr:hypothetical protein [Gemmatimonadota bacterium]MBT4609885.1 hypothetical protein [Gemmatimonadota bacterium]MBT5056166.1 hypothetical protein [Gemmatimonadota bacterium]MBT5142584.1 hypothetical protein [Gemmatimonadota bacterium]MBT5592177.1 hypothetical protein [Gemmatimonadota bacterium]
MSIKSFIAIALAMCGSFTTILAVVGYVAQPTTAPRKRNPPAISEPALAQERALSPASTRSSRQFTDQQEAERVLRDVPTQGPPQPLPDLVPIDLVPADLAQQIESGLTHEQVQRMAREASARLEGVESSLGQQIVALKKSRDAMLDQLSDELKMQTPSAAATLLLSLDDELAALSLKRLPTVKRRLILEQIPGRRRNRLNKLLQ